MVKKKMSVTYKDNIYFRILSVFPLKPVNAARKTSYFSRIFFSQNFFLSSLNSDVFRFPKALTSRSSVCNLIILNLSSLR